MYQWRPTTETAKAIAHAKSKTHKEVEEKDGMLTATIGSVSSTEDSSREHAMVAYVISVR